MTTNRLEAFSDGVIAIIITIMVLEFKVPEQPTFEALRPLIPIALSYLLSFVYIAIYWHNHHHMMQVTEQIDGRVMWANTHLLLWLSVVPFSTAWLGEHFGTVPVFLYGLVLLMCAVAFALLEHAIIRLHGPNSSLARATAASRKEKFSILLYLGGTAVAFWMPWISIAAFVSVAIMWMIPDRRIERVLDAPDEETGKPI